MNCPGTFWVYCVHLFCVFWPFRSVCISSYIIYLFVWPKLNKQTNKTPPETHLDWPESPLDWRFAQSCYCPEVCPRSFVAQSHPHPAASGLRADEGSTDRTCGPPTSCCCRLKPAKSDTTVQFCRHFQFIPSTKRGVEKSERRSHSLSRSLRRSDLDSAASRRRRTWCQCSSRRRTWTDSLNSGRYKLRAQKIPKTLRINRVIADQSLLQRQPYFCCCYKTFWFGKKWVIHVGRSPHSFPLRCSDTVSKTVGT